MIRAWGKLFVGLALWLQSQWLERSKSRRPGPAVLARLTLPRWLFGRRGQGDSAGRYHVRTAVTSGSVSTTLARLYYCPLWFFPVGFLQGPDRIGYWRPEQIAGRSWSSISMVEESKKPLLMDSLRKGGPALAQAQCLA